MFPFALFIQQFHNAFAEREELHHYRKRVRASGNEIKTVFLYDCHMFMIDYRYEFSSSSSHIQPFIDNLIDVYFEFYLIFALLDFEAGRKIVFTYESEAAADFFLCKSALCV